MQLLSPLHPAFSQEALVDPPLNTLHIENETSPSLAFSVPKHNISLSAASSTFPSPCTPASCHTGHVACNPVHSPCLWLAGPQVSGTRLHQNGLAGHRPGLCHRESWHQPGLGVANQAASRLHARGAPSSRQPCCGPSCCALHNVPMPMGWRLTQEQDSGCFVAPFNVNKVSTLHIPNRAPRRAW